MNAEKKRKTPRRVMGHGGGAALCVPFSETAAMPPIVGAQRVMGELARRLQRVAAEAVQVWEAWKDDRKNAELLARFAKLLRRCDTLREVAAGLMAEGRRA